MAELYPDEPATAAAEADPGRPKSVAHEACGAPQCRSAGAAQGTPTRPARPASTKRRGPSDFRQRDVTRVLKATLGAGVPVKRVEYENGKIALVVGEPDEPNGGNVEKNEWDEVFDGAIKTAIR